MVRQYHVPIGENVGEDAVNMRLRFIYVCLGLLSFYVFLWLNGPPYRITYESFARIKEGMTEKEVESIFGVPAGDYETKKRPPLPNHHLLTPTTVPCEVKVWKGNGLTICIWFDAGGKVLDSRSVGWVSEESSETFLDKLRRLLCLG